MKTTDKVTLRTMEPDDIRKLKVRKEQKRGHKVWLDHEEALCNYIKEFNLPAFTLVDKKNTNKILFIVGVLPVYTDEMEPEDSEEGEIFLLVSKHINSYAKEMMEVSDSFMKSCIKEYKVLYGTARKSFKIGQTYLGKLGFKRSGQTKTHFIYKYK